MGVIIPYKGGGGHFSMRGVTIPWQKNDPGVSFPWGSKYHMTPDTILKEDYPNTISVKFGLDWLCSFRGEDF